MSTLIDRRDHQIPSIWRWRMSVRPAWRDLAATIIFAAFGLAISAAALVAGIPLFGPDTFAG